MSWVPWTAVLVRHVAVGVARMLWGSDEAFHAAVERLREHLEARP